MVPLHLETDVPESREVSLTLPPGVPPGRVRLTVEVEPTGPDSVAEYEAFQRYLPRLQTVDGKFVAVYRGVVWAVEDRYEDARQVIEKRFGAVPAYIGWVPPAPEVCFLGQVVVASEQFY